ncbi:DUF2924 domain-containing protein [Alkalicaulis satelles]|uniref:DUF2924 domain-containing protein n=1 Tax=Alkalicaulis satelles TaxID=2609175 RepID=A0A5M6ZFP9_9PROT|nr:DUF2924 domain-containing protein [Alkalicaulis satelles]KAA5803582.1 DUF2924 domain-containing protein [Alkalicaulis satelles]
MSAPDIPIAAALAELDALSVPELKARWQTLFDGQPPPANRGFLISRMSYRIQELRLGGLDEGTRRRLRAMADDYNSEASRKSVPRELPPIGTRLVRSWQGEDHTVTITRDGFEYEGRPYASLTAIARRITGTHWSGPYFFGLVRRRS